MKRHCRSISRMTPVKAQTNFSLKLEFIMSTATWATQYLFGMFGNGAL